MASRSPSSCNVLSHLQGTAGRGWRPACELAASIRDRRDRRVPHREMWVYIGQVARLEIGVP